MKNEELITLLQQGDFSCIVAHGDDVRTYHQRGVIDLYNLLLNEPVFLQDADIADKVVGKAAASLMILGNIQSLYATVISRPALNLLLIHSIPTKYNLLVPHIINRKQTDWCPLEKCCFPCETPQECFQKIDNFINHPK